MMKKVAYLAAALVLMGLTYLFASNKNRSETDSTSSYSQAAAYPLLAKRLFIEDPNDTIISFGALRKQIADYKTTNNLSGSIYFEYLPTGTSIRVDGDQPEVAASLFKLPAAMELQKAVELNLVNLDSEITLEESWLTPTFGSLYKKGAGYKLTLREALRIMLEDSDNTALNAIGNTLSQVNVPEDQKPYNFLDIDYSQNIDLSISISARSYSSFLKCLYFSCYLNKTHSSELLDLLSKSSDTSRLASGVTDKNIKIAHKIGNFAQDTQSDCGIVYLPRRNYVLCVMIKGPDSPATSKHIAEISRISYDFVNKH
jgi:beta-lactamase class A